jgi:hypothetical protein
MNLLGKRAIYTPTDEWVVIVTIDNKKARVKFPNQSISEVDLTSLTIDQKPILPNQDDF